MLELDLCEVAEAVAGGCEAGQAAVRCAGVSTDTRRLRPGELFVALAGERFDGHDLLAEAAARGAVAAVVARAMPVPLPQIVVADTRRALGDLARAWRRRFTGPVVAVTGSNGKTTTKEMAAAILRERGPVLATAGNLNNEIGVPLTLFGLGPLHRAAVVEMGANHPGEIGHLCGIALPTVAVVTVCGPAHLEGFGSLAGVAAAKGEIYTGLAAGGAAVVNADDPFAADFRRRAGAARVLDFAVEADAAVRATEIADDGAGGGVRFTLVTPVGSMPVRIAFDGLHNVTNALAAATSALAAGATLQEIGRGLAAAVPAKGRLSMRRGPGGMVVIDDTYNANPASLVAALQVLGKRPGRRWLLLGDMGELGDAALEAHRQAGRDARAHGVERMFALGTLAAEAAGAFGPGACVLADHAAAAALLAAEAAPDVTLLAKGSRRMALERVVDALAVEGAGQC